MFDVKDRIARLRLNRSSLLKEKYVSNSPQEQASLFFSEICGMDGMKENLFRALTSELQVNILLLGPPATSKTLFMSTILKKCNNVFYFDAANTTSAGLIEDLYHDRSAKLVIIDEIDKLKRNDLNSLLGLLNDGRIVKVLKNTQYDFTLENVKVFATSNSLSSLSKPLRSRFQEYHLREYSDTEFLEVVCFCLQNKLPAEINEMIGMILLEFGVKDVRTVIGLANLIKNNDSREDVVRVVENWINHKMEGNPDFN